MQVALQTQKFLHTSFNFISSTLFYILWKFISHRWATQTTYPNTHQLCLCVVGKLSKRASGNPAVRPLMHMRVTYVELYMLHWCVCVCVYVMLGVLPVCIKSYEYMCVYVCSHWAQCAYENMCICVCEINIFYIKGWLAWWRIMLNVWLCVR